MYIFILISSFLLTSCGAIDRWKSRKAEAPNIIDPEIREKAQLYISLQKSWSHKCDSVGFEALCKLAGGCQDSNIFDAEGSPGRWYRTPEKTCYETGGSVSDISKDMFVMLFPYLWQSGNIDALKRIHDYGSKNRWIMGRGPLSRTFMTPPMALFLGEMTNKKTEVILNPDYPPEEMKAGFEKHLDVIAWMTQAMVRGYMSATDYEQLRKYADDQPRNALFQALREKYREGDQRKTLAILKNEQLFPKYRLPTSSDRCEPYLWQRYDEPGDWQPCGDGRIHDGTDFLMAAWVAGQL